MLDTLTHRWLKIPYTLNVRHNQRPKGAKVTLLFIHGIGNSGDAWRDVVNKMPPDVRVVTIDLLGFGDSPKPKWAIYNAKTQARSVLATFFKLRITTPVIIIGHSLGALVAIEMAKRYPLVVNSLILCSPPLYDTDNKALINNESVLMNLYKSAQKYPDQFMNAAAFASKYNLVNKSFSVTDKNIDSYMAALGSMIINQTSLQDAYNLKVPTVIIRGTLDPFVVPRNFSKLTKQNSMITVTSVIAGHEVQGLFIPAVVKAINNRLQVLNKSVKINK